MEIYGIDKIIEKFKRFGIPEKEILRYNEPHRYYHNFNHIEKMVNEAERRDILTDDLFLAIVFHDIIYNPKTDDNEEKSAELFYSYIKNDKIKRAILETKTHIPTSCLSKYLCDLDLSVLYGDYEDFVDYENKIFKEYQFLDYKKYKEKRLELLGNYGVENVKLIYVRDTKHKIAVYAGSFNPFHVGHYNILVKAERIFDKVIIARGINVEKNNPLADLPAEIQYRQTETYNGLLTDFILDLGYDVTLVRGIRDAMDFQNELKQYRYLQDMNSNIKMVSIFCDKGYEHISSSAVRNLGIYDKQDKYLL